MPTDVVARPFAAFNFAIELKLPGSNGTLCNAAFAECDGLEMTMDVKTLRAGGDNVRQLRLAGPVSYGQLTLKRGMTDSFDLWDWFDRVCVDPSLRASGEVIVKGVDRRVQVSFVLERCLPMKLKAPALNARDGTIAVEEMQIAYELMRLRKPSGGSRA
jgi:phage tail-like protein